MTLKNISQSRDYGLDIIKSLAIFFVIGVHFFLNTYFYKTDLNNTNLFFQVCIQQLFLSCIPLFLISTGYLNDSTDISIKYFKKIIPIICIYLFYSLIAILYRLHINDLSFENTNFIEQILTFKGHRYSWYMNLYFGLFLLIPFFNKMYFSLGTKKEKATLIFILILLTMTRGIPNFWSKIYPLTYFFIGKFIKEFKPDLKGYGKISLIGIVFLQGLIEYILANSGRYINYFNHYTCITRMIQSVLLFLLLYQVKIKNKTLQNIIVKISSSTLDIYLASFLTDRLIYKPVKEIILTQDNMLFLLPILVLSSFIFAYIIARLRIKLIKFEKLGKSKHKNKDKKDTEHKKQVA